MNLGSISFFVEETEFPLFFNKSRIRAWIRRLAQSHGKTVDFVNFIFCSDPYILQINRQYLDHDYFTDIITFPYKEDEEIAADIYISLDTVRENARDYGAHFQNELLRVMAHGILHLSGFGDKVEDQVRLMRQAEDEAVSNYFQHMDEEE